MSWRTAVGMKAPQGATFGGTENRCKALTIQRTAIRAIGTSGHPCASWVVLNSPRLNQLGVVLREDRKNVRKLRRAGGGGRQGKHVLDDTQSGGGVDQNEELGLAWAGIVKAVHHAWWHVHERTRCTAYGAFGDPEFDLASQHVEGLRVIVVQVRRRRRDAWWRLTLEHGNR